MTVTNTIQNAVALNDDQSAYWVQEHEPFGNIITQERFGFITLFGSEDIDVQMQFGETKIKKVPALIQSDSSASMKPTIEQYLVLPTEFTANAATTGMAAGSASNVTLVSTAGLKKYDLLKNRTTGAVIQVYTVSSSTVISVYPHAGGTSGDGSDNVASGQLYDLIGNAYVDGATFGSGFNITPATNYNYMQFFCEEYGQGLIRGKLKYYPGENNQLAVQRLEARIRQNRGRELAFLFGERAANADTDSSVTTYSMHGLTGFSSTEYDAGGSLTWDEWTQVIHPNVTSSGGGDFHAMAGKIPLAVLSSLNQQMIKTTPQDKVYGNKVERIRAPLGDVILHGTEPMDKRDGEMLFFQPGLIKRKYLRDLNNIHITDIHAQNTAKNVNGFLSVECIVLRNEDCISTVTNVNA